MRIFSLSIASPLKIIGKTAGAVALLGGSFVLAQDGVISGTKDESSQAPKSDDDEAETTSPDRYTEVANESLASMRVAMQKGLDEVKKARDEKDALRLTCVNEPVTAMKGVLRVAEDANVDLQEAVAISDTAQSRREFRKIKKSKRRMNDLLTEAQNCAGAESSVSTTSVEVTIDEDVIALDPYYGNPNFFFDPSDAIAGGETGRLGEPDGPTVRPPPASGIL